MLSKEGIPIHHTLILKRKKVPKKEKVWVCGIQACDESWARREKEQVLRHNKDT